MVAFPLVGWQFVNRFSCNSQLEGRQGQATQCRLVMICDTCIGWPSLVFQYLFLSYYQISSLAAPDWRSSLPPAAFVLE